ncbi:trypsin-like peptidase domain-containing protein [archaeon]|nr:trypsin-like peptidase domain-containing protein [archaeon]MBT4241309.1 trypsin-like peptidase domain-containing protein [archaeon]MBT4418130.1 trypsin-like peptidase domain-containing protein [archaeon]
MKGKSFENNYCKSVLILISLTLIIFMVDGLLAQTVDNLGESSENNPLKASVRIIMKSGMSMGFCSGTIIEINEEQGIAKILTAGHCLKDGAGGQYFVDYGPGTPMVSATYLGHNLNGNSHDIGLMSVPVDKNDLPGKTDFSSSFSVKKGDNIYHVGHPGGEKISIVGAKLRSENALGMSLGFSQINFPPRGGRSGGGIFSGIAGEGEIYTRGRIFGVMTHREDMTRSGLFANQVQIKTFLS